MTTSKRDYLGVVEAIYAPAESDEAWLQGITDAAFGSLNAGLGVNAYTYDAGDATAFRLGAFAESRGDGPTVETMARNMINAMTPQDVRAAYAACPRVATLASVTPDPRVSNPVGSENLANIGMTDAIAVKAQELSGVGCVLVVPSRQLVALAPRTKHALDRVAAHLMAGYRLRRRPNAALDEADAVFTARGKAEHLSDVGARGLLEAAIAARGHSQRIRKRSPEGALELWRGLVSGRWSLVDHVDRDGKRFILARRNPPGVKEPTALTANERVVALYSGWGMSNKLIAYELGLAPSTISGLLASAMRKLKITSRSDLAALMTYVR